MTQKRRSPRGAGNVRKLAGWAHRYSTFLEWLPVLLLAGFLVWQGVAR